MKVTKEFFERPRQWKNILKAKAMGKYLEGGGDGGIF
jgi:hypothetical protein